MPSPIPPATLAVDPFFHVTSTHPLFLLGFSNDDNVLLMYQWDTEKAVPTIIDEKITRFLGDQIQSDKLMDAAHRIGPFLEKLITLGRGAEKELQAKS